MIRIVHFTAALIATGAIALFWSATTVTEAFGSHAAVVWVKQSILWGMAILVLAIATAGVTGFIIGGKWKTPLAVAKKRRMPFIAANGILILMPSAFFLASRAGAGTFDLWFYAVQAIELAAGAVNLTLMGLNIRDGLRLSGKMRKDRVTTYRPVSHPQTRAGSAPSVGFADSSPVNGGATSGGDKTLVERIA